MLRKWSGSGQLQDEGDEANGGYCALQRPVNPKARPGDWGLVMRDFLPKPSLAVMLKCSQRMCGYVTLADLPLTLTNVECACWVT